MAIAFNSNSFGNFGAAGALGSGWIGQGPNLGNVGTSSAQFRPAPLSLGDYIQQLLKSFTALFSNWQGINMPLAQVAQLPVRDDIRESIHRQMAISGQRQAPTKAEIADFEKQFDFIPGRQRYPEGFGWTRVESGILYNSQGVPIGKVRPEHAHNFPPPQPPVYQPPVYQPPVYQPPVYQQPPVYTQPPVYQPATPPPPPTPAPQGGYQ